MSFVHCRVQSDYSFGHGASKVKDLFKRASELGQPALALVDQDAMNGVMKAVKYGEEYGVQPIVGAKLFVPLSQKSHTRCSVLAFAQSEVGYANICRILQLQLNPRGVRKGLLDRDTMMAIGESRNTDDDLTEGVTVALGTGADSAVGLMMADAGDEAGFGFLQWLRGRFGGRCYAEVCRNGYETPEQVAAEKRFVAWAIGKGIPLLATTEVLYATPDRHDSYNVIAAIGDKRKESIKGDAGGMDDGGPRRYHLRSTEEMVDIFRDLPEAVHNTVELAVASPFWPSKRNFILPTFETDTGRTETEELKVQARAGLERRLAHMDLSNERRDAYFERLEFELGVIEGMKFPGYFLIVSDFIKWAKEQGIPVGPGRGSGAGSLVAYALTITDIDPLPFGLLFERFLNPERVSMPDFDIDFCETRRGEVIGYVQRKYGESRVGRIMTHTEFKPKSGWRDVARVLSHRDLGGISQGTINEISKYVPKPVQGKEAPIHEVMAVPEIAKRIDEDARVALAFEGNKGIQGIFKNPGVHAAGIVIGDVALSKLVPMGYDEEQNPATMFDMKDAETVGLVKFDFLGLTTLSVIQLALAYVRELKGIDVDLGAMGFDDKATLDIFAKGRTTGIFQFESEGMQAALRDVKADRIEDLIAVNALYRPGPMEMIPTYAACKNGKLQPEYPEPVEKTRPYLQETYGVMVYQEQIMQVAQVVAGLSLGGADLLRRAIGKKDHAEMAKQKRIFIDGAVAQGSNERTAEKLFALIEKFADYGFNKSHAAAYSVVAYHTAWIKAHHPECFFAALFSYKKDNEGYDDVARDMAEFGVALLTPDVNKSHGKFRPEALPDGRFGVRFGLKGVKGVTEAAADKLVDKRTTGPFTDLIDFDRRCQGVFNSGQLQSLCMVGSFESINPPPDGNRRQSFETLQFLSKNARKDTGVVDMFGATAEVTIRKDIRETTEWTNVPELEKMTVGFYLNMHPLDFHKDEVRRLGVRTKAEYDKMVRDRRSMENVQGYVYAMVESATPEQSKYGAFVKLVLAERDATYSVKLFPPRNPEANVKFINTPDMVLQTANGAKNGARPVVVKVKVITASDGQRAFLNAVSIESVESFIGRMTPSLRHRITYDVNMDPVCIAYGVRRVEASMRERIAGGEDPNACMRDFVEFLNPVINKVFKSIETDKLADMVEPAPGKPSDVIEIDFRVSIGGEKPVQRQVIIKPFPTLRFRGKALVLDMFKSLGGVRQIEHLPMEAVDADAIA